jgi:hypothetical protein
MLDALEPLFEPIAEMLSEVMLIVSVNFLPHGFVQQHEPIRGRPLGLLEIPLEEASSRIVA